MSLCHPAMFLCAFVTYIIKILRYCIHISHFLCSVWNPHFIHGHWNTGNGKRSEANFHYQSPIAVSLFGWCKAKVSAARVVRLLSRVRVRNVSIGEKAPLKKRTCPSFVNYGVGRPNVQSHFEINLFSTQTDGAALMFRKKTDVSHSCRSFANT